MTAPPLHAWLNALLAGLRGVQDAVLWLLHAIGLAGDSHAQPAWPFASRIAGETLIIDQGLARQFAWMLAAIAFAVVCALIGLIWRRTWRWFVGIAVVALAVAPWPSAALWLAPAVPTSFHVNPDGFSVTSILRGERIYMAQCASCHGNDGRGEGPRAASLRRWPPTMASGLLARRADGDLFWHVLYGMRDAQGVTMPGFAGTLGDRDIWATLDYLRVLSASAGVAAGGSWPVPIAMPGLSVQCGNDAPRTLAAWRGTQRVRVIAVDGRHPAPNEDPRFLTLLLTRDGRAPGAVPPSRNTLASVPADCVATSPDAWQVYADIAGTSAGQLAGAEWLADRDGWLRAQAPAGKRGWADGGLLCTTSSRSDRAPSSDPLTEVLRQMDAEPVRYVKGGFVH